MISAPGGGGQELGAEGSNTPQIFNTLRKYWGFESFREGQRELIEALLRGQNVLGVMATGQGKRCPRSCTALGKNTFVPAQHLS